MRMNEALPELDAIRFPDHAITRVLRAIAARVAA